MFDQLNERLAKVKNQLHKRRKWKDQLADYEAELQEKKQNASRLKSEIQENQADIEDLEEASFAHLLAVLTGSTDEKIKLKQQEIAAAKLKYDESQQALNHIEQSIKDIREKIDALPDIDQEYQNILKKKEELITEGQSVLTSRYNDLSEEIADLQSFLTETSEAISAGEQVTNALNEALEKLDKAKGWGGLDMFGGGLFVTHIKHGHIDDAKESIHRAQTKMRIFHKELLDVQQQEDMNIEMSGLLTFADYFFDGFFIDYVVQGKIEASYDNTKEQHDEIDRIILGLNFRYDRKEKDLNRLEKERKKLLENSDV